MAPSPRSSWRFSLVSLALSLAALAVSASAQASSSGLEPIAPVHAPFPFPQLSRPAFPARVVSIADHGAVADGTTKNTAAIAKAIAVCAEAGGGRVLVPAGKWLTGPIHLRSNIDLHLADGAELIFSDVFEDYLPVVPVRVGGIDVLNYSPLIYARDCVNVGVTGAGKLNGNAKAWWAWAKKETKEHFQMGAKGVPVEKRVFGTPEAAVRPSFVVFYGCKNVLMEGFTIGGGPNWTIHPVYSDNIIIRRVHVLTDGPNNDGIDPDSCRNVLIEHCVFDTGDDCVVLKSGYNEDGWRVARPTENVVMRWCSSKQGHGGLVVGSEMSGDVRNVYMYECEFTGTDRAIRIKSRRDRGGVVENVWAEDLKVKDLKYEVVIMNMDYSADRNQPVASHAPLFRNIHVSKVTGSGVPVAIRLQGMEESLIQDITFSDMQIGSKQGVIANYVKNVSFKNVQITPAKGPAYLLSHARGVVVEGAKSPATESFLTVDGADSTGIRLVGCDLTAAKQPFTLAAGVPADAVTVAKQ